jgi:DNA invertase Pin-like site-specific DNA recombinase
VSEINVPIPGLSAGFGTLSAMEQTFGYARVSTWDQNPDLQIDALREAGIPDERILVDHASGAKERRPQLDKLLERVRAGDTVVVWKLDRFGRSRRHLEDLVRDLGEREIGFRCLTCPIDTTTPAGRLFFVIFAALAEFERDLIIERTRAGLAAARARGRVGGRKPALTPEQADLARELYDSRRYTVAEVAARLKVGRTTLYRYLGDR